MALNDVQNCLLGHDNTIQDVLSQFLLPKGICYGKSSIIASDFVIIIYESNQNSLSDEDYIIGLLRSESDTLRLLINNIGHKNDDGELIDGDNVLNEIISNIKSIPNTK